MQLAEPEEGEEEGGGCCEEASTEGGQGRPPPSPWRPLSVATATLQPEHGQPEPPAADAAATAVPATAVHAAVNEPVAVVHAHELTIAANGPRKYASPLVDKRE